MSFAPTVGHLALDATLLRGAPGERREYLVQLLRAFAVLRPRLRFTLFIPDARETAAIRTVLDGLHPSLNSRTWVETIDRLPHADADVVWYPGGTMVSPARTATRVVTLCHGTRASQPHRSSVRHRMWCRLQSVWRSVTARHAATMAHGTLRFPDARDAAPRSPDDWRTLANDALRVFEVATMQRRRTPIPSAWWLPFVRAYARVNR